MENANDLQEYSKKLRTPEHENTVRAYTLAGWYMVIIEKAMENKGIDDKQLAEMTGLKVSHISRIFNSEVLPSFKDLAVMEKCLELDFLEEHNKEKEK